MDPALREPLEIDVEADVEEIGGRFLIEPEGLFVRLGNSDELSVGELAKLVAEMTGTSARIVYRPLPSDDPVRRCPDISRARELLGWSVRVPLRDGLRKTIAHFQETLAIPAQ